MTIDEAVAMADEIFAQSIIDLEALLIRKGATDAELTRELERAERTRVQERARVLAELRAWLAREGETLH